MNNNESPITTELLTIADNINDIFSMLETLEKKLSPITSSKDDKCSETSSVVKTKKSQMAEYLFETNTKLYNIKHKIDELINCIEL